MTDAPTKRRRGRPARLPDSPPLLPFRKMYPLYLSDSEAAEIDAARGRQERSGFCREWALDKARRILAETDQS